MFWRGLLVFLDPALMFFVLTEEKHRPIWWMEYFLLQSIPDAEFSAKNRQLHIVENSSSSKQHLPRRLCLHLNKPTLSGCKCLNGTSETRSRDVPISSPIQTIGVSADPESWSDSFAKHKKIGAKSPILFTFSHLFPLRAFLWHGINNQIRIV